MSPSPRRRIGSPPPRDRRPRTRSRTRSPPPSAKRLRLGSHAIGGPMRSPSPRRRPPPTPRSRSPRLPAHSRPSPANGTPEPGMIVEDSPQPVKKEPEPEVKSEPVEPIKMEIESTVVMKSEPEPVKMEEDIKEPVVIRQPPTQPRAHTSANDALIPTGPKSNSPARPPPSIPTGPRNTSPQRIPTGPRANSPPRIPTGPRLSSPPRAPNSSVTIPSGPRGRNRSPPRGPRGDRFGVRGRGGRRGGMPASGTLSNATPLGPGGASKYQQQPSTPATPIIESLPAPEKKENEVEIVVSTPVVEPPKPSIPLPPIPVWDVKMHPERAELHKMLETNKAHRANLQAQYLNPEKNPQRAVNELDLATIDWRAAEGRTARMHVQVELARAGKFGVDYEMREETLVV
ncbi:hypothetical protein MIND_01071100 [Mycena indigotica]|uniref:Uncharacterized protein n=1 Tax=Mycena indigotica TaxID=2126181 RepID=A0A8H6S9I3_9AGAR|nr:uncharacterized protein MIND_01071100 [Mycena indigotica]KAF7295318.1 hypothetical protein MIND_01071100 [Mycena indigotica]